VQARAQKCSRFEITASFLFQINTSRLEELMQAKQFEGPGKKKSNTNKKSINQSITELRTWKKLMAA
jgi:hypothetical protein